MFRQLRRGFRFRDAPLRLAVSVFFLFALLLAVAVAVGMQYERSHLGRSIPATSDEVAGGQPSLGRAGAWPDLVKVSVALLVVAAVGILSFTTFQNYRAITQTFERVKARMRNILQSIPTGVLTLDSSGIVTSLNSAAERLLGLRASAAVGRPVDAVLQTAPDLAGWMHSALAGARLVQESDVTLSVDGGRRVTVRASASELRNESGQSDGLVILLRDITEVNRLEWQLRRSDRLAALGTLAAGVAHEVKNPLSALSLNLHLLEQEVVSPDASATEIRTYFDVLRSELHRIHRIVENFLRFSKPSIPEVKPLDLNGLLERVVSLIAFDAADHGVSIETVFDPALASVPGDEGQLSQVFLNLVINALQAMPAGGVLVLTTGHRSGWAEVAVRDSGEGIEGEILPHVFDPYFTTRPRGIGLGLAIAHRIVEGHRGTIDVESEVGKGTTMMVRLPLTRPEADGQKC